jgi:hypothetical protein
MVELSVKEVTEGYLGLEKVTEVTRNLPQPSPTSATSANLSSLMND